MRQKASGSGSLVFVPKKRLRCLYRELYRGCLVLRVRVRVRAGLKPKNKSFGNQMNLKITPASTSTNECNIFSSRTRERFLHHDCFTQGREHWCSFVLAWLFTSCRIGNEVTAAYLQVFPSLKRAIAVGEGLAQITGYGFFTWEDADHQTLLTIT